VKFKRHLFINVCSYLMNQQAFNTKISVGDRAIGESSVTHNLSKRSPTKTPNAGSLITDTSMNGYNILDTNFDQERFMRQETEIKGHTGAIYCAAYSNDGSMIASGGIDRTVRIWSSLFPYKQV